LEQGGRDKNATQMALDRKPDRACGRHELALAGVLGVAWPIFGVTATGMVR
jgi:hypothetical protein